MTRQAFDQWHDENLDRRVTSDDGTVAVVWLCLAHVKKAKVYRPRLVRLADHETMLATTVANGRYFIHRMWGAAARHLRHIEMKRIDPTTDMVALLFAAYKAATI